MKAPQTLFACTLALFTGSIWSLISQEAAEEPTPSEPKLLSEIRQVTFAGKRAGEGYFSADGSQLVFQSERDADNPFFQIYLMDLETGDVEQVSPGHGKTTCAWIHPSGEKVLYASTHADPEAKAKQAEEIEFRQSGQERRYAWDYDENFDIWVSGLDGADPVNLTRVKGYDAEGSYSPDGQWIAFASNRHAYTEALDDKAKERFEIDKSSLMDIYRMRADGSDVQRLTDVPGYDGGPFFSADGRKICWRRFNEHGDQAEIWTMDLDGSNQKQITQLGAMSWAPFFHPSGDYLIFATNLHGFGNFELYLVDADGKRQPVRVTHTDGFDGLPAFSPDGETLAWTSNRTPNKTSQLFFAKWDHAAALAALDLDESLHETESLPVPDVAGTAAEITVPDIRQHVEYLASDALQGRLTGTEGERLATAYVAKAFESYGLQPGGDGSGFFQSFEFTAGVELGPKNQMTVVAGDETISYTIDEDWRPLSFSLTGRTEPLEVAFAGYGIDVPAEATAEGEKLEEYSSYAHLDVKDKWVMMFRYAPHRLDDDQRQRFARFSSLRYKAMLARQRGAKGILVVSGPNSQVKRELAPMTFDASLAGSGIVALSITDEVAQRLLEAGGKSLKALQDALDTGEMAAGIAALPGVTLQAEVDIVEERRTGRNVLGVLKAVAAPSEKPVIFGAHIDHLGAKAGANSRALEGEEGLIHHGADDNASGVAGLMEIAQQLAALQQQGKLRLKRDLVFAAWSGEELGLLGSAHYVKALAAASGNADAKLTDHLAACLNMDMIGRLRKALILQGVGSSDFWPAAIEQRNVPVGLPIVTQNDTYIATDATSFYLRGVPILSAFTGAHDEYHTPRDTVDTLNFEGIQQVSRFMALMARGLATGDELPAYQETEKPDELNRGGLRVYLGTIPDYAQGDIEGVKLSGVRKGGPAANAGVESGDIIVKLGGKEIKNIYDYTFVIGTLSVGQETEIVVKRQDEVKTMTITPASRE